MESQKFRRALLGFLVFTQASGSVAFAESEMQSLKKEVRELKQTVEKLTNLVENQNQRIDQLEGRQKTPENPAPAITGRDDLAPKKETVTQRDDVSTQKEALAPETADSAQPQAGSNAEVDALLGKVNNSPPVPGANTAKLGLWRVPTGSSPAAKLIPDISVIGTFSGSYYQKEPVGETGPNPAGTGFTFQELEIGLQGVVDPYFRYDAFLSFGIDEIEVEEAYFTTLSGPPRGMQFRGGQFLLPFGRQNQKHLHAWAFADQNLVNQYLFGPDNDSELGLEMSYLFPTPFFMQLQGTFTNGSNETSFGGEGKGDFLYQGRLSTSVDITDSLTALMGTSGAVGFNNSGPGNTTSLIGGDFLLKWKPSSYKGLSWQTEYIARLYETPSGTVTDGGLYSYVDYQFLKRWHAEFRYDQVGIPVGLVTREFRLTPAITFTPSEFSQIRLQYEFDKISGEDASNAAILQFEFILGVHGAHLF